MYLYISGVVMAVSSFMAAFVCPQLVVGNRG
jgi:hypothetical protein